MKSKILTGVFSFFLLSGICQDAKEIVKKADDKMQGNSNISQLSMTIVRPTYTRTIEFKNWSLGRDYFMTLITAPAKDKGQVFMKYKTDLWNFMPAINRMIKLPPSMMSQGWMGSDYTNDDLVKQTSIVNDYEQKILGNDIINNSECYKIEMIPHDNANVVWGKVVTWIDKEKLLFLKSEYFDEEGYLVRTELASKVKVFDNREIPSIIEIISTEEPQNKTILEFISIDFDVDIQESFFTQQNMKKLR
ncbi:MAG: outer membrane lipoprotein-sorting protein [Salinivirgaceae bacterium]|jgi:outer membrane lipoprotein-sorting protein